MKWELSTNGRLLVLYVLLVAVGAVLFGWLTFTVHHQHSRDVNFSRSIVDLCQQVIDDHKTFNHVLDLTAPLVTASNALSEQQRIDIVVKLQNLHLDVPITCPEPIK